MRLSLVEQWKTRSNTTSKICGILVTLNALALIASAIYKSSMMGEIEVGIALTTSVFCFGGLIANHRSYRIDKGKLERLMLAQAAVRSRVDVSLLPPDIQEEISMARADWMLNESGEA